MKIRSITYFLNPRYPTDENLLENAGKFIASASNAFQEHGYEVQTRRLATIPFPRLLGDLEGDALVSYAQQLEKSVRLLGFDYLSLGPALPEKIESFSSIIEILSTTESVFVSGLMTTHTSELSLPAVRACARVIHAVKSIKPDGFANLNFAALAKVLPGSPFFPAAYHSGDYPAFALATEAADLAVDAFSSAKNLSEGRSTLIDTMQGHANLLQDIAQGLADRFELYFRGIDFSLAPFPQEAQSLGAALERMGLPAMGLHGSLAAAAFLVDAMDRVKVSRTGFSGLFFPVLEDAVLSLRAAEGTLSIKDLLLYAAVCGTGLDTVPLPGDTTPEQLEAILLDVAALAHRLDKPLTARLMPIPGKAAGDPTAFDFAYFANSRVMPVHAQPLSGLLTGDDLIDIRPRSIS
jgi:uncharacterized protein (UPF0210 family)